MEIRNTPQSHQIRVEDNYDPTVEQNKVKITNQEINATDVENDESIAHVNISSEQLEKLEKLFLYSSDEEIINTVTFSTENTTAQSYYKLLTKLKNLNTDDIKTANDTITPALNLELEKQGKTTEEIATINEESDAFIGELFNSFHTMPPVTLATPNATDNASSSSYVSYSQKINSPAATEEKRVVNDADPLTKFIRNLKHGRNILLKVSFMFAQLSLNSEILLGDAQTDMDDNQNAGTQYINFKNMMTKMDGIYRKDTESKVGQSKIGSPINEFIRLYNEDPNQFVDATGKPISPAEKTAIDDFIQMLKDIGGEKFAKINSDLTPEQFDEAVHDLMDMVVKQINVDLNNYGIPLIELKLEKGQDNINPTDWADSFEKMATHFTNLAPTKTAMMKTLMDSYTMMITQMHQSLEKLSNLNTSLTR